MTSCGLFLHSELRSAMRDEINSKDELLKFVFFPSWVIRSARYNERSLSSLLDIQTLHSFLSVEDISVIFVLNQLLSDTIEDKTAINTLLNEWSGSSIFAILFCIILSELVNAIDLIVGF